MNTYTRDPQFATFIEEVARSVEWPDATFTVTPWEAAVGVVIALYESFATPDRVMLRHALQGIAF